ncbi:MULTISPECIES: TIGR04211 family SH3 domain-containing protein [Shewanella]|uniref:TIGR04211 family SH3 domain-containing protein n=2 Tax=Gammaproteobacteria TaxID=1236 RepID=A0A3N4DGR0_9GAMM|nr:TIGR04211 family SH3 domain-containing protein [Shewanella psychromarinicola]AZG33708.1 TIGR04211 family SH3 domain-containing protein [Shewanella psychromarinicola]MCL1083452.1 TIGR04211 family SH3 domain-containing protein [Shewanella psychromarinicola]RPA23048.1 TIGR04211 family SH3 domain-containing protein [Shewanella psychromarinicola]
MLRVLSILIFLLAPSGVFAAQAPTRFISDDVYTFIHGGPGTEFRILGSVEAGQPITLLDNTDGDFTQIIDHKGREGWVLTSLVTDQPSFRERFPEMEAQLKQANEQLNQITQNTDNTEEYLILANEKVTELNAALTIAVKQRDEAELKVQQGVDNRRYQMWQQGGLIGGMGALIGIILVYLPRPQRRKNSRWM